MDEKIKRIITLKDNHIKQLESCKTNHDFIEEIKRHIIDLKNLEKSNVETDYVQTPEKVKSVKCSSDVRISDLLDIIHYTVIKKLGKNEILLKEVQAMEWKIRHSGEMENFSVEDTELWKSILNHRNCT